jgi:hypothetical protein
MRKPLAAANARMNLSTPEVVNCVMTATIKKTMPTAAA